MELQVAMFKDYDAYSQFEETGAYDNRRVVSIELTDDQKEALMPRVTGHIEGMEIFEVARPTVFTYIKERNDERQRNRRRSREKSMEANRASKGMEKLLL